MEELQKLLARRLHISNIKELVFKIQNGNNAYTFEALYGFVFDEDKRISNNAAWVLTHLDKKEMWRLFQRQESIIDKVLKTTDSTMQRLLLSMLLKQPFRKEEIKTDFLDFCLLAITSPKYPVSVRVLCCYLSFKQCCHFTELLEELKLILYMMDDTQLNPSLAHAKKKVLNNIKRLKPNKNGLSFTHK